MGPDDQYSYYYNSNTADQSSANNYPNYSSRTNQYNQHTRQTSSSTPAQTYDYSQNTYGNDQPQQYSNQSYYGNARDGGQRAAETLSRMGSSTTTPSSTATAYNHTQTANTYGTNYNSRSTSQYSSTLQNAASTYPSQQSSYATASANQLARPNSVNSDRSVAVATRSPIVEPLQQPRANVSAQYSRTQLANSVQRSASPAQIQASHQLQRLADQRAQETNQTPQTNQQSFVDPSAVYDPWPEYQRKLAAARAAQEAEDKAAAEREAEEKKLREEKEAAEEAERQLQEDQEKQRKKEEGAQKRAAKKAEKDPNAAKKKRKSKGGAAGEADATMTAAAGGFNLAQLTAMAGAAPAGSDAEAQIRQLMAMVKQMNDKHPDLLAKIWEEERQQHLEQSLETPALSANGASTSPKKKKKTPKKAAPTPIIESSAPATQAIVNGAKSKATSKAKAAPPQATSSTAAALTATAPKPPAPPPGKTMTKANNAARGTIWPPEKKGQIASAAARWLSSLPGAPGRPPVTATQISSMLDKNPTYIELCEMIEQLGFKVERAAFAKALLTSVPDVNANRSAASPAIPRPPSTGPLRAPAAPSVQSSATTPGNQPFARPPLPVAISPTQPRLPDIQLPASSSPYFDTQGEELPTEKAGEAKASKGKSKKKAADKKEDSADGDSNRPSETPGPATKAEAARKRTFADLVDLTTLSDEELLPPAKRAYFGPPAVTQPGQAYSTKLDFLPNFDGSSVIDPHLQRAQERYGPPPVPQAPQSFERQQMMVVANKLNQHNLAKQVDRKDALRRSKYDIRTLARDVLLATGKHPDLLPLNGHLESLRNAFPAAINFNSDLATLRWDLIDGGEPIPEALALVVNNDADSVIDDADDESEEDVRHFAVRAPSRTQSVAIGASGSPGMGGSTFVSLDSPRNFTFNKGTPPSSGRGRGRPRGRPPGFVRFSTGGAQMPIGNHRPAGPPSSASPAPRSGGGYAAFTREVRPDGTKRRGRPLGWRKAIHQRGVGVEAGGSGYTYVNERPKQAPAPPPATEPKFTVYRCMWQNCSAELHNLQTLRQHVNKKHGVPDRSGKFSCLWQDCGRQVQNINAEGAVVQNIRHFDYPDTPELMTHVEHRHIRPIGWELGDGPPGGFSGMCTHCRS
jgi:hypothetical protein